MCGGKAPRRAPRLNVPALSLEGGRRVMVGCGCVVCRCFCIGAHCFLSPPHPYHHHHHSSWTNRVVHSKDHAAVQVRRTRSSTGGRGERQGRGRGMY